MVKCKHGVERDGEFCCRCNYGERSYVDHHEKYWDTVRDISTPIGYRLKYGFNMIRLYNE